MGSLTVKAAIAVAALLAAPSIGQAAWGHATGNVNMRTCASAGCGKITVVPEGARVWVGGRNGGWYQVRFNGHQGYVSGNYIALYQADRPRYRDRPRARWGYYRSPRPQWGYYRDPWWDHRYGAWYDGRRWYRNGVWYDDPRGFSFGFSFGG